MQIEILGMHDSIAPGKSGMCLLLNQTIALDAGALTDSLPLERQKKIEHIILTHCHFDHIKGLPFFADGLAMTYGSHSSKPARVHSPANVIDDLRRHIFNNVIWPDFTAIPPKNPVLAYHEAPETFSIDTCRFRFIPVTHGVPTYAIHICCENRHVLYVTDTGPTMQLWNYLNDLPHAIDAMFIDVAFPNRLEELAILSGHLTPGLLARELEKTSNLPAMLYPIHMKSPYRDVIGDELAQTLKAGSYHIPEPLDIITF
ncbi:3',5'-cyclic-nucleotide phosphodiesterase [Desulfurispirillum indicum]|uniref:Beta-lactamase domain-containing protein n=1 Tax=Desulfurispirillum indicum (strain ATCC BAA-1389 / DSM 22839 / S5) TaxID=653733 RepID=E6W2M1_DESIS|nr:3',5'-cyclic-nucleotide phosphodiesterase [Desulfurispirillum indicum]ADU65605.1 beta-lactamase domain-containing protein [Desulfurispirillum indicum S5]UCZ57560.1 3',5'-cyclic-nucleotide phosphodiesterase [Desulfurispirillum indicum]